MLEKEKVIMIFKKLVIITRCLISGCTCTSSIKKLEKILGLKKIFDNYEKGLKTNFNIKIFHDQKFLNWVFVIILKNNDHFIKLKKLFNNNGVQLNYFWKPLHTQKPYKNFIRTNMMRTNKIWNKVVILPSHPGVNKMQQNKIIDLINKVKNNMFLNLLILG